MLTIFRHAHIPEELNKKFLELFKSFDILFVECAEKEAYERVKKIFNFPNDDELPESLFKGFTKYKLKLYSIISKSKKHVEVEKSPISIKELEAADIIFLKAFYSFINNNLEEAHETFFKLRKKLNKILKRRDESITNQLIRLYENENKGILVLVGALHRIYYPLKNKGLKVKQTFPYLPYSFPYLDEVDQKLMFGKHVMKEDVMKGLVDCLFRCSFERFLNFSYKTSIYFSRKIIEKMSLRDIEELSFYMSRNKCDFLKFHKDIITWIKKKFVNF